MKNYITSPSVLVSVEGVLDELNVEFFCMMYGFALMLKTNICRILIINPSNFLACYAGWQFRIQEFHVIFMFILSSTYS